MPGNHVITFVPWRHLVVYFEMDLKIFRLYLIRVIGQKILYIDDSCHNVWGNGFCNLAVFKKISHGFAGVIIALHLCDHGKMGADIVPETVIGFDVQIDHFLDVKNFIGDIVNHIS